MSTAPAVAQKRGKGALITGAVLLVLGIILTFLGIAVPSGTAKEITGTQLTAPKTAPAEWTTELAAATTYGVYAEKGKATEKVTGKGKEVQVDNEKCVLFDSKAEKGESLRRSYIAK